MPMPWERGTQGANRDALARGESAGRINAQDEKPPPPRGVDNFIVIDDRDNERGN